MEREIAARHAEERLELEASYLGKFEKWNKGALAKFDERRAEVSVLICVPVCVAIRVVQHRGSASPPSVFPSARPLLR